MPNSIVPKVTIKDWLQLVRLPNLIIVWITQIATWLFVVCPFVSGTKRELIKHLFDLLYISTSTVLIAASGYIINDYFDVKIDAVNRPDKNLLTRNVPRKWAILLHTFFNLVSLWLASLVAFKYRHPEWMLIQVISITLLWFYSTHFKRQFVTGNVIVALLTAFSIITVLIYEPTLHRFFSESIVVDLRGKVVVNPVYTIGIYALFAFFLTWIREIVKDMEDYKGDAEYGCITMPIKWGLLRSGNFAIGLAYSTIGLLVLVSGILWYAGAYLLLLYTILALIIPLYRWTTLLHKHSDSRHYYKASKQLKWLMLLGIASLLFYYFYYAC